MTNLDSMSKSRDINLPTKICIIKAMVFPISMYRWDEKKVKAKITQSCPTLCDHMAYTVHGIL